MSESAWSTYTSSIAQDLFTNVQLKLILQQKLNDTFKKGKFNNDFVSESLKLNNTNDLMIIMYQRKPQHHQLLQITLTI